MIDTKPDRMAAEPTSLGAVARALAARQPELMTAGGRTSAAVALILRQEPAGLSLLLIERATREGDPWSGDLGFPGGKVEAEDPDPRAAAERETREELGLDLPGACFLGRLDDIVGAHLPVLVSCFAYGFAGPVALRPGAEVRDAFWVPLAEIADPARHSSAAVRFGGEEFLRPAIILATPGKPVLWGITYRLVMQFLALAGES